jgi:hypothetical protein
VTRRDLVIQWVQDRNIGEVADLLISTKANQVAVLRAYATEQRAALEARLATFDATTAAGKTSLQNESASLVNII